MRTKLNDSQIKDILTRYKSGSTSQQLAKEYCVSFQTILRTLKKHNVQIRPTGRRKLLNITHRICCKCKVEKPISQFKKSKRFAIGYGYVCKECHRKQSKLSSIERNFGISITKFKSMEKAQGGTCAICGKKESRRRRGTVVRLAIDHNHKTGEIRGLLCTRCNTAIGLFDDCPKLLKKAIAYLEQRRKSTTHCRG